MAGLEGCKAYDALIGLPERTPDALLADKGYVRQLNVIGRRRTVRVEGFRRNTRLFAGLA